MSNNTQKLKKPRNENLPKIIFPLTTEEAILRGTFQSLLGCLIEAQKETEMPVWLCGGDSKIIFEHLKNRMEIIHCPNIVLEAMIEITL